MKKLLIYILLCTTISCLTITTVDYIPKKEILYPPIIYSYEVHKFSITPESYVEKVFIEYYIYFGTKETNKLREQYAKSGTIVELSLIKPILRVEKQFLKDQTFAKKDKYGWYAIFINTPEQGKYSSEVFNNNKNSVWDYIPQLTKHCLKVLFKDKDIALIKYDYTTNTVAIFFRRDKANDEELHKKKCQILIKYLNSIGDFNVEIKVSDF